jgi:hypothetical protein
VDPRVELALEQRSEYLPSFEHAVLKRCCQIFRFRDIRSRRPDGIGHPLEESDHSESITGHQSDMVSLGFVQGCFKVYGGLFRVGFRVGLRFLQDSSRFVLGYI